MLYLRLYSIESEVDNPCNVDIDTSAAFCYLVPHRYRASCSAQNKNIVTLVRG